MATAARQGMLEGPASVAAVLATGDDYVRAGRAAMEQLDARIAGGSERLASLRATGAGSQSIAREAEQVELAAALRDRIAQSIERVTRALQRTDEAGRGENDPRAVRRARDRQVLHEGYAHAQATLSSALAAAERSSWRPG